MFIFASHWRCSPAHGVLYLLMAHLIMAHLIITQLLVHVFMTPLLLRVQAQVEGLRLIRQPSGAAHRDGRGNAHFGTGASCVMLDCPIPIDITWQQLHLALAWVTHPMC